MHPGGGGRGGGRAESGKAGGARFTLRAAASTTSRPTTHRCACCTPPSWRTRSSGRCWSSCRCVVGAAAGWGPPPQAARRRLHCRPSPCAEGALHPPPPSHRPARHARPQGTDGTGQAILPQVPALSAAGYDVRTLYLPPEDRSGWEQLQSRVLYLLRAELERRPPHLRTATLVAESFGGCLGLRAAAAAPSLVRALVLLNPATSFAGSLGGVSAALTASNLLALFPRDLYTTAQTALMPLLVRVWEGRGDCALWKRACKGARGRSCAQLQANRTLRARAAPRARPRWTATASAPRAPRRCAR